MVQEADHAPPSRPLLSRRGLLVASAAGAFGLTAAQVLASAPVAHAAIVWGHPFTFYSPRSRGFGGGHNGIDYTPGRGTTIHAVADGVVTVSTYRSDWGQYVKVDHGGGYHSLYAHMIEGTRRVMPGDGVKRGTPLGLVGSTGDSTGPHLHIEIYINTTRVDPDPYVDANKTAPLANAPAPTPPVAMEEEMKIIRHPDGSLAIISAFYVGTYGLNDPVGHSANIKAWGVVDVTADEYFRLISDANSRRAVLLQEIAASA